MRPATAPVAAQRAALLAEAAREMDDLQLFIPIAAPIRWSLVRAGSRASQGTASARHTLTDLDQRLNREGAR